MGIKGLLALIRKKCPQVIKLVHVSQFSGTRMAIDMPILLHKLISSAVREVVSSTAIELEDVNRAKVINLCTRKTLNKLMSLQRYGITPILIADGIPRHEKKETIEERIAIKKDREAKINDLAARVKSGLGGDAEELRKMYNSHVYLTKPEIDSIYSTLANLGYPCIRAKHDSEQLGAALAVEGFVSTVYSTDSDCLAFGSPSYVYPLNKKERLQARSEHPPTELFYEIKLRDVLIGLEVDFDQFRHICIMAGCDYNSNIPNFAIGKALSQLKTGKVIKASPEAIAKLNYEECMSIFRTRVWENCCESAEKAKMNFNKELLRYSQKILSPYGMEDMINEFLRVIETTKEPKRCPTMPPTRLDQL